jgi:hypothetical protein
MIDEWVELEAPNRAAKTTDEPVTIAVIRVRHGSEKVSLSVDERLMSAVGWPRYRIDWNRDRKAFRVRADPGGGLRRVPSAARAEGRGGGDAAGRGPCAAPGGSGRRAGSSPGRARDLRQGTDRPRALAVLGKEAVRAGE